ncbi:MAG: hypothetical protein ACOX5X_01415 [Acholeplasmataceae bacterium]|jgi:type IV secretory pathway ATPase VirB11/archaellum biosynthesis ATPase
MIDFVRYYIDFLRNLWNNIVDFFRAIFAIIANIFYHDPAEYIANLIKFSKEFNFLDWIAAIVIIALNIAFVVFLIIRLALLLRKYIKFNRSEITKEKLMSEIGVLSQRIVELTDEKNQILALKMETVGLGTNIGKILEPKKVEKTPVGSRFTKLIEVDNQYADVTHTVYMQEKDFLTLKELVQHFINFSASQLGLFYEFKVVASYFAGMATSNIIILEGISGTGKTSLPYAMGRFFNNTADIISVQPSWRDRSEMIGYLNEFTKKFNESDFLKALYEATYRDDINFIVLDELNLARIEYYFAEFLSILEMPNHSDWLIEVVPSSEPGDPQNLINGKILVPENVWFIGTANKDDSTFTITDKVYDRASTIEMNARIDAIDAPYTESIRMSYEYLNTLFESAKQEFTISHRALNNLDKLDEFITSRFKVTFGNRILKQIRDFIPVYVACGGEEVDGLDLMVARKVLRKFESLNLPFLVEEINELIGLMQRMFGKDKFTESIEYLESLLRQI